MVLRNSASKSGGETAPGMPVQFLPGAKNVAPIAFSVPLLISILKTIQININGNVISFLFQQ